MPITPENLTKLLAFLHERTPEELISIRNTLNAVLAEKQGTKNNNPLPRVPATPTDSFQDDTPMPFGKYKGTPLSKVPADYLCWLWSKRPIKGAPQLEEYIRSNLHALKQEHPDGIWT